MFLSCYHNLEKPPKAPEDKADSVVCSSILSGLLEQNESFKPTQETIINAMKHNHLDTYIKPISSLTVLDSLGEGKIVLL